MSSGSLISYRQYNRNQDVDGSRDSSFETKIKKCRVYGFLDLELPFDYYKRLLYDLHEENKSLKRMNKMSSGVEDSRKKMSNNSNNQMVKDLKANLTFVKSKLKVYDRILLVDGYENGINTEISVVSSDSSTDEDTIEGPSIASVPKEDPSIANVPMEGPSQELLKWYGCDTVEEYSKDTFMDTTNEYTTNKDTTDNDNIDEDTIDESYFPKSKVILELVYVCLIDS
ncbi:hypothetical protein Tco_0368639 [Tanacetum coccineum]